MYHRSKRQLLQPRDLSVEDMPLDSTNMKPVEAQPARVSGHEGYRPGPFDHEQLDVYRVVREALVRGEALAQALPPEHAGLASELRRALVRAQLGVAHAGSRGGSDRGERACAARAEVARAAAALDAVLALGLVEQTTLEPAVTLLGRVSAMLGRLGARDDGHR